MDMGKDTSSKIIQVGNLVKRGGFTNPQEGRVYSTNGIAPTLRGTENSGRYWITEYEKGSNQSSER